MIANLVGQFPEALLASALGTSRTGSNARAVHARASATGGALLACDPHLPITLPNPWLIAAYRCPSYHVAGLMLPGLPFVVVGRNPWIAWGGMAAHAASSDLFDLSSLQDAFIREGGFQCGICTPGQLIAATALLAQNSRPSDDEIREWMMGNLCRCTGYHGITRAIKAAVA